MSGFEFGVEYDYADRAGEGPFITGGWTETAATAFVRDHSGRSWHPRPARVMRRPVGPWEAVNEAPGASE